MEKAHIWNITDRTLRTWLSKAVEAAAEDGVTFSVPVKDKLRLIGLILRLLYVETGEELFFKC